MNRADRWQRHTLSELLSSMASSTATATSTSLALHVGQQLVHEKFGSGKIVSVDHDNLRGQPYEVRFEHRRRHVYCAGMGMPVILSTGTPIPAQ